MNPVLRVGYQIDEAMHAHDKIADDQVEQRGPSTCSSRCASPIAERRDQGLPASVQWRDAAARHDRHGRSPTRPTCSSPTSPRPRSTSPCRRRSSSCSATSTSRPAAAIILITHNLGVVAGLCKRVLVMYAGEIVEEGTVEQIFESPAASVHVVAAALGAAHRRAAGAIGCSRSKASRPTSSTCPRAASSTRAARSASSAASREAPPIEEVAPAQQRGVLGDDGARLRRDGRRRHQSTRARARRAAFIPQGRQRSPRPR